MRRNGRFNLALGWSWEPPWRSWCSCSWALGQATWVWYEHVARRELPFPSLADVGFLVAIPLAAAAMLAFPDRSERAAPRARSLLDGAVIATSLLYTSWALVLGPVFGAGEGSVPEQAIALAYPVGDVVLATVVFVVVARIRVGGAPVLPLGAGLLGLAVADTGFAYLTQEGTYRTGRRRRRLVPRLPADRGRRPPARRRRDHLGRAPAAPWRPCARPSPSASARSRSGPASASPSATPPRSTPSSARPTSPCTPPRPAAGPLRAGRELGLGH
jgi:hypothetical protein